MKKHYPSKLDPFAEQLDHWFGVENMTFAQAIDRLHELGCDVSRNNLSHWCRVRRQRQWQEQLLHDITSGAQQCEQVEKEFCGKRRAGRGDAPQAPARPDSPALD